MAPSRTHVVKIYVDGYDTILKSWVFDLISIGANERVLWQFSKSAPFRQFYLADNFGCIIVSGIPLDARGRLAVQAVDTKTDRSLQPVAPVAPLTPGAMMFLLKARTAAGSSASQQTTGQNHTDPTYSANMSLAAKLELKIFGSGVETTGTTGVTRNSSSTTATQQSQTTITTPVEVIQDLQLTRRMSMPEISMLGRPMVDAGLG